MKALLILLMAPMMLVFAIGALQTIEWCIEMGFPVPITAYILLIVVTTWCFFAGRCSREDAIKANRVIEKWIESLLK